MRNSAMRGAYRMGKYVRKLGIEADDILEIAEQAEL